MVYSSKNTSPKKKEVKFVFESKDEENKGFEEKIDGFDNPYSDEYIDSLGLTRSEELSDEENAYGDFFRDPKVMSAFTEHLDLTDRNTRKGIMRLNEADQNAVLTALTSKLYDNIVSKVDDIDYGEIPSTKGDITQLSNYGKICECVDILRKILTEYKQDTSPVDAIAEAISNVETRKDLFERAFKFDVEMPIIMYNNSVLSIISGVSYMIATCIEFIKTPNQNSFEIVLDKIAYSKTKHMIYKTLKRFNKCCGSGEFDKTMNHIITARVKGFNEAAVTIGAIVGGTAAVLGILVAIVPLLREMVFMSYYSKMRMSEFFDVQADLIQMNAYNLENNDAMDDDQKQRIVSKQLKIVELFRKASNKIAYKLKKSEVDTEKEIESQSNKVKLNDIGEDIPDSVSALF